MANTEYTLEYEPHSPMQKLPLKDAELKLELFANGEPHGYKSVTTDANQKFSLDKDYALQILSIKGQEQYHSSCSGYADHHNTKILVTCQPNR